MKGIVRLFNASKGYGFIEPESGGQDVHARADRIEGAGRKFLVRGETVEFDVEAEVTARNPTATFVRRLERRTGVITEWDDQKGYGYVTPDDGGQRLFLHFRDVTGTGGRRVEERWAVDFATDPGSKSKAVRAVVIEARSPLERFAVLTALEQHLEKLAGTPDVPGMAQKENWSYRHTVAREKYPILRSYLYYTFARLEAEGGKIAEAESERGQKIACFNTGLVTERQESIFALFTEWRGREPYDPTWELKGFFRESDHQLSNFADHPETANYFTDPVELLYDTRIKLVVDKEHVVVENRARFPVEFQRGELDLITALEGAVTLAKKRVKRNYKTAVPQFHRGQLQLLLPLCLKRPEHADNALVVARVGQVYRGSTVLTLDMAYNNARLIARPDTEWLDP